MNLKNLLLALFYFAFGASYAQTQKYTLQPIGIKEVKLGSDYNAVCSSKEPTKASTLFIFISTGEKGYIKINNKIHALENITGGDWDSGDALHFKDAQVEVLIWQEEELSEGKYKVKLEVMAATEVSSEKDFDMIFEKEVFFTMWPLQN